MALTEEETERIEAYLAGTLPSDQRQQVDGMLAQNAGFRQAFDQHRTVWESLRALAARERFRRMHQQLEREGLLDTAEFVDQSEEEPEVVLAETEPADLEVFVRESPQPQPFVRPEPVVIPLRRSNRIWYYAAASVMVGVLAGSLVWVNQRANVREAEVTFKRFYQPEQTTQLLPNERRLKQAIEAYHQDRLDVSEKNLEALDPQTDATTAFYREYYLGLVALARHEADPAITHLEAARLQAAPPGLHQRGEWYLGLAYLKAHRLREARTLFGQIAQMPGHAYQQKAREVLAE